MRRFLLVICLLSATVVVSQAQNVWAYNFGDYRSTTLATKAWDALKAGDMDAVLAYTNKCIELYAEQARKMQNSLVDYPAGDNDEIFSFWALNDVATCYFIQGEAYRQAGMNQEAKEAYQTLIDNYSYGQAWDPQGWFWKPAEAAQGKLNMLESGKNLDFGDYSSSHLVAQAWKSLEAGDVDAVEAYTDTVIDMYGKEARKMQNSLTEYPWENKEDIFSYWALNDVGTALFIKGETYRKTGETDKARSAYKKLIDQFYYAQTWDPQGWFWKPAEAAEQNLAAMGSS